MWGRICSYTLITNRPISYIDLNGDLDGFNISKYMGHQITLKRRTYFGLIAGTLLSLVFLANFVRQVAAKESVDENSYELLKTFTDVLALVQKNYVEPVDTKELIEGAIKGMLTSLDPHSSYLPPEGYKELQVETKGTFGGLGIEITVKDGLLTVVTPIEDSPAAHAGVLPNDQIIKIGEEFTRDLTLVDAVKKMRGPKGSPITISVHRENAKELIPLTIIRDVVKVKSVRSRMLDEGYGYVRLAQFQEGSADEFGSALTALASQVGDKKLKGLVIDLRNNPGGLLTQAIRVSDLFLEDGLVVYTDGRLESQKTKYYAHKEGNEPSYPIVVLINGGSASASEIVAGALQDAGRAVILGNQSFGKGSVQTILPMEGDSALRLTTALYFTRNGRSIQAKGITPDISVSGQRFPKDSEELLESDEEEGAATGGPIKEKDLPGAIHNPKEKEGQDSSDKAKDLTIGNMKDRRKKGALGESLPIGSHEAMQIDIKKLLKEDPQLDEALKYLKSWYIFRGKPPVQANSGAEPVA